MHELAYELECGGACRSGRVVFLCRNDSDPLFLGDHIQYFTHPRMVDCNPTSDNMTELSRQERCAVRTWAKKVRVSTAAESSAQRNECAKCGKTECTHRAICATSVHRVATRCSDQTGCYCRSAVPVAGRSPMPVWLPAFSYYRCDLHLASAATRLCLW